MTQPNLIDAQQKNTPIDDGQLTDQELMRYSRQILLDGWDIDAQLRLKAATVAIIGLGGLGTPASQTLARAGVGQLRLFDFDTIEASNLQRQTLFFDQDIGQAKVMIAAQQLSRHNPDCQITATNQQMAVDSLIEQLAGCDLVLDCTDNFVIRDQINKAAVCLSVPLLSAAAIADYGQLALFEPNLGCYQCLFSGQNQDDQSCATTGVLASTTAVMGNLQAHTALEFLGRKHNPLQQKLLLWQGSSMTQRMVNYRKDDQCDVCGLNA